MSKRSIPFIVGGVLVLGVCAVLAWEAIAPTGPDASLTSASASAGEGNPTAAEIAALKPAADEIAPTSAPAEPAPDPAALAPVPPASADAPTPPARSQPPVAPRQGVGALRSNTFVAPRPQTAAAPKPSAGKPQAITDFGGRRY